MSDVNDATGQKYADMATAWEEFWVWMSWLDDEERLEMIKDIIEPRSLGDTYQFYADDVERFRTLINIKPDNVAWLKSRRDKETKQKRKHHEHKQKQC